MKTLFAFYSHEGNCRELAAVMAEAVGGEVMELRPAVPKVPPSGIMKYYRGGKGVILGERPELLPLTHDAREYELVVVGWPVWFFGVAPPARTFIESVDWSGRRAALFSMHRGGQGSSLDAVRRWIQARGGTVISTRAFVDLRRGDAAATRCSALEWIKGCVGETAQ